jgi:hypothetical protein
MDARKLPSDEVVAATDEVFSRQPLLPQGASSPVAEPSTGSAPEAGTVAPTAGPRHPAALKPDYVRELQQEFVEQEERGKL